MSNFFCTSFGCMERPIHFYYIPKFHISRMKKKEKKRFHDLWKTLRNVFVFNQIWGNIYMVYQLMLDTSSNPIKCLSKKNRSQLRYSKAIRSHISHNTELLGLWRCVSDRMENHKNIAIAIAAWASELYCTLGCTFPYV